MVEVSIRTRLLNMGLNERKIYLPAGKGWFDTVSDDDFREIIKKSRPTAEATIEEINKLLEIIR